MQVTGLTGGIGVGKSTVAQMFADLGAVTIDVDGLGRDVIGVGGPAVAAVVQRFGSDVQADDGSIDRAALAPIVFGDADELAALNAISHPAIDSLLDERLVAIAERDPQAHVILDMAILTESTLGQGTSHPYEHVVVVEAPAEVRLQRLIERGHTAEDAAARMASQTSDAERRAIADFVIANDAGLDKLRRNVATVWTALTS